MMLTVKKQKNNKPKSNDFIRRNIIKEQIQIFENAKNILKTVNIAYKLVKN